MPCLQVFLWNSISLLWGQTWWDKCTGRAPLAIPLMIFMTTQEHNNWGSKWTMDWISCKASPQLGRDLSSGTSHTISVHAFLKTRVPNTCSRPSEQSMNIIKSNMPRGLCPLPSPSPFHPTSQTYLWHFWFRREALQVHRVWMTPIGVYR